MHCASARLWGVRAQDEIRYNEKQFENTKTSQEHCFNEKLASSNLLINDKVL